MQALVILIACGLIFYNYQKDESIGISFFLFVNLFIPVYAGFSFSTYSILFFITSIIFKKRFSSRKLTLHHNCNNLEIKFLFIYIILYSLGTILGQIKYQGQGILRSYSSIIGMLKVLTLVGLLSDEKVKKGDFVYMLKVVLLLQLLFEFIQLRVPYSANIFYDLYFRNTYIPLETELNKEFMSRGYGTFASPIDCAIFLLFALFILYEQWLKTDNIINTNLFFVIAIICGVFSYSKTFYAGSVILFVIISIFSGVMKKRKRHMIVVVITSALFLLILLLLSQVNEKFKWYIDNSFSIEKLLNTRLNQFSGNLVPAIEVIKENILFGVGGVIANHEFVGDSLFVEILHDTGGIGFLSFLTYMFKNLKVKKIFSNVYLSIWYILIGMGLSVMFNVFGILYYVYSCVYVEEE